MKRIISIIMVVAMSAFFISGCSKKVGKVDKEKTKHSADMLDQQLDRETEKMEHK